MGEWLAPGSGEPGGPSSSPAVTPKFEPGSYIIIIADIFFILMIKNDDRSCSARNNSRKEHHIHEFEPR